MLTDTTTAAVDPYEGLTLLATTTYLGRYFECPCGARHFTAFGRAARHAATCPTLVAVRRAA